MVLNKHYLNCEYITENSIDDDVCKQLWEEFADVLIDYDNPDYPDGIIENDWFIFEAGMERIEIWRWFDEHYSKGVHALMFPSKH